MTRRMIQALMLLTATLLLAGCSDSDKDETTAATPSASETFASVTPSGLSLDDKFVIAGRGVVYNLSCAPVAGAATYTFTTSFGASETVAANSCAFNTAADAPFTFNVYATNAEGINTRTASAAVN